jgi:Spy/CpxP family protein refolding chaperone
MNTLNFEVLWNQRGACTGSKQAPANFNSRSIQEGEQMRRITLAALILLAVAGTVLIAQNPPQAPSPAAMAAHRVDFMTTVLTLTSAQQQQATTIFTNAATAESGLRESLKAARQNLKTAVANNDSAGIDQASTTIGSLTAQQTSIQAKANAAFYQILNADQQSKLTKLEAQRGPGGRPGPPPGGTGGFAH